METAEAIRVYWQPGCSSCVKVKEFLKKLDVPFVSVNVLEHAGAAEELQEMGAMGFPVIARGKEFVFGQSLSQVAEFVQKKVAFDHLPVPVLMDRMFYFMETGMSLAMDIPTEEMDYHPIPNRDRSLMSLAYHCFQVPEGFLETMEHGTSDLMKYFDSPPPEHVKTQADIVAYGRDVAGRIQTWWKAQKDKNLDITVNTFYGEQRASDFLERSTWHTAQHVRQVQVALEERKVTPKLAIDTKAYQGLPMPEVVWQ